MFKMKIRNLLWFIVIVFLITGSALNLIVHFSNTDQDNDSSVNSDLELPGSSDLPEESIDVSVDVAAVSSVIEISYSGDKGLDNISFNRISEDHPSPVSMDTYPSSFDISVPAMAIVIDDFGYSLSQALEIADIKIPLTWSIIPDIRFSSEIRDIALEKNIPFLVHVPMQAFIDEAGGPYLIGENMAYSDIRSEIRRLAALFPNAVGINNHRGSKATSDQEIMKAVMDEIAEVDLAFLDSRTSSSSVAYSIARDKGISSLYNSVFLDHEDNYEFILRQFNKAKSIAQSRGWVVAICHVRPETIKFLSTLCNIDDNGVEFFTVPGLLKMLLEYKEVLYFERKS